LSPGPREQFLHKNNVQDWVGLCGAIWRYPQTQHMAENVEKQSGFGCGTMWRYVSLSPKTNNIAIALLRVIPIVPNYFVIVSDTSSDRIYGMYFLTFYSGILSDILF